nr:unnamed protein product [Digitaria exilis]
MRPSRAPSSAVLSLHDNGINGATTMDTPQPSPTTSRSVHATTAPTNAEGGGGWAPHPKSAEGSRAMPRGRWQQAAGQWPPAIGTKEHVKAPDPRRPDPHPHGAGSMEDEKARDLGEEEEQDGIRAATDFGAVRGCRHRSRLTGGGLAAGRKDSSTAHRRPPSLSIVRTPGPLPSIKPPPPPPLLAEVCSAVAGAPFASRSPPPWPRLHAPPLPKNAGEGVAIAGPVRPRVRDCTELGFTGMDLAAQPPFLPSSISPLCMDLRQQLGPLSFWQGRMAPHASQGGPCSVIRIPSPPFPLPSPSLSPQPLAQPLHPAYACASASAPVRCR